MDKQYVDSSVIEWMRYKPEQELLELAFKRYRRVYHYYDVPGHVVEEFRGADSLGAFFNTKIKGHYREKRVQ